MSRGRIQKMALTAMFAALIAVFSQLTIPSPSGMPLTLQTFVVALTGYVLGARCGAAAVGVYIAVGAAGAPVFTAFQGGLGALFGPTSGFIFGFTALAFFCGIKTEKNILCIICALSGLIICHICGILWFSLTSGSIMSAFMSASLPYIPKDILSVVLAGIFSKKVAFIVQKLN